MILLKFVLVSPGEMVVSFIKEERRNTEQGPILPGPLVGDTFRNGLICNGSMKELNKG